MQSCYAYPIIRHPYDLSAKRLLALGDSLNRSIINFTVFLQCLQRNVFIFLMAAILHPRKDRPKADDARHGFRIGTAVTEDEVGVKPRRLLISRG